MKFSIILMLVLLNYTLCWKETGHMLVARIAENVLEKKSNID
jgi:hypothetical protein